MHSYTHRTIWSTKLSANDGLPSSRNLMPRDFDGLRRGVPEHTHTHTKQKTHTHTCALERPYECLSGSRKRGVEFEGGSLHGGFDGFGGSGKHLVLLLLVLQNTVPRGSHGGFDGFGGCGGFGHDGYPP